MVAEEKRCKYVFPDGRQCKGYHGKNSDFCFGHDPEKKAYRELVTAHAGRVSQAVQRGDILPRKMQKPGVTESGDIILPFQYTKLLAEGETIEVKTSADLLELMNRLLTLAMAGKVNAAMVNSITQAVRTSAKLLELEELEDRLRALEEQSGL